MLNIPEVWNNTAGNNAQELLMVEAASPLKFKFEPLFDYGFVSLERGSELIRLPATRLQEVLDGYMSQEDMKKYLESC